jgi:hypothetical protein
MMRVVEKARVRVAKREWMWVRLSLERRRLRTRAVPGVVERVPQAWRWARVTVVPGGG